MNNKTAINTKHIRGHGIPFTPRGGKHKTAKDYYRNQQKKLTKKQIINELYLA